jgi:hypothetical protein
MPARRRAGPTESSVLRDLRSLKLPVRAGQRGVLEECALTLARALDAGPPVPVVAKLVTELRVLFVQLREVARERDSDAPGDGGLSTPDWDTPDAGAPDAGPAGGGGGSPPR